MGKKSHLKYKQEANGEQSDEENESFDLSDITSMISIINGNDDEIKDKLCVLISNFNFEESKDNFISITSKEFLLPLTNLLQSMNNISIKTNIISAIINILISFYDSDNCQFDLFQYITNRLISSIEGQLSQYENNQNDTVNKFYCAMLDLLLLIVDLTSQNEKDNTINYNTILKLIISNFICNLQNDNKLLLLSLELLYQIVSTNLFIANDSNCLDKFILWAEKVIKENKSSSIIMSNVVCSLFYLGCSNHIENNFIQNVIDKIYKEVNQSKMFINDVEKFKEYIEKYITSANKEILEEEDSIENVNTIITSEISILEEKTKSILTYLKTFSDIIDNVSISSKSEDNNIEMEIEDDFEEIEDSNNITNKTEENSQYNILIAKAISSVINEGNIKQLLSSSFFDNFLPILTVNTQIEVYLIDAFDKMISLKDNLSQVITISFSILNNIILNYFNLAQLNNEHIKTIFSSICKILTVFEKMIYNDNNEFISVVILLLRNILEKTKHKMSQDDIKQLSNTINYKTLFLIMNKFINDNFIKTNIIDTVSFLFSYEKNHDGLFYTKNKEICNLFITLFYNENSCEVLAHVINAFMDIYQWDDDTMDKILLNSGVVNIMRNGSGEFKSRLKIAYKSGEVSKDAYDYIKETLYNMKRFIKYKEEIFKKMI